MEIYTMNMIAESINKATGLVNTLGNNSYTSYCRVICTAINRRILSEQKKLDTMYRLILAFNNAVDYYTKMYDKAKTDAEKKEIAKTCLVSIYLITRQSDCIPKNEGFEKSSLFTDIVDAEDWAKVSEEDILKCDLRIQQMLIQEKFAKAARECRVLFLNSAMSVHNFY